MHFKSIWLHVHQIHSLRLGRTVDRINTQDAGTDWDDTDTGHINWRCWCVPSMLICCSLDWACHGLSNPSNCRGWTRKWVDVDVNWILIYPDTYIRVYPSCAFARDVRMRRRELRPLARPGRSQRVAQWAVGPCGPVSARPPNVQGPEGSNSQRDCWHISMWHNDSERSW